MKHELRIFFTAVMYYTRIPCPSWVGYQEEYLNQSTKYFPLIGWVVGAVASVIVFLSQLVFDPALSIIFSMAGSVLLTGAFHEDGFADVCDGFGGGWTKEKILLIMKDSRLGTYGVVSVIFMLAIKFMSLYSLIGLMRAQVGVFFLVIISAHALSRFTACSYIFTHQYVRLSEDSKVKPVASNIKLSHLYLASFFGLVPFIILVGWLNSPLLFMVLIPLFLLRQYLGYYFEKWIGGYTGDCLGAVQQLAEVLIYLSILGMWKCILPIAI